MNASEVVSFFCEGSHSRVEMTAEDQQRLEHLFTVIYCQGASAQRVIAMRATGYSIDMLEMEVPEFKVMIPANPKRGAQKNDIFDT